MKPDRLDSLRRLGYALLLGLLLSASAWSSELTRPDGLEPEIAFWRAMFGEVTSGQAAIHDDRHLGVVYGTVDLPAGASASQRRKTAESARKKYRDILDILASGRREGLTSEQRRVLALWPADVSKAELRSAKKRIRFQQGLADRFRDGYERSGLWRDYIRDQLKAEGVPLELAALPHVESSFNPGARSHVGAAGLWQFTRATGRRFMQVDHVVDARRDPFMSSHAAARLLAYNYSILKSWPLAISAYNHGVAGMRRAVRSTGTEDIETIIREYRGPAFGFASRNFYVAFLAALEVETNARQYFGPLQRRAPSAELVVSVPDYIPAEQLAKAFGIATKDLQASNPALLAPVWSGTKHVPRGFPLRVPIAPRANSPARLLASVPARVRFDEQTPDLYHRIERGESLSVIATRYRTSVTELMALNGLRDRHRIRAGQTLRLPVTDAGTVVLAADAQTYRVRRGDTVGNIARRAGISERELLAINGISDRNRIYAGQDLKLRSTGAVVAAASAVTTDASPEPEPAPKLEPTPGPAVIVASLAREVQAPEVQAPEVQAPEVGAEDAAIELVSNATDEEASTPDGDALLADPSDYLVAADGSIEVQAAETLGHYADWLEVRTQRLRDLNGYAFRQPLVIGERLRLDLGRVDAAGFAARRIAHHRELQAGFFARYRVADTTVHKLRRGESVWVLTTQRYQVPVWLLRQYNPDLDLDRVRPGDPLVFPQLEPVENAPRSRDVLADAS